MYDISEVRLRFELDASFDPNAVLLAVAGQIDKAFKFQEQFKDFHVITRVPSKKRMKGKKPCCLQMAQPAGTELKLVIQPSEFQGDTDDAELREMSDKQKRHPCGRQGGLRSSPTCGRPCITATSNRRRKMLR
ncbi:MAG: hypothetical protein IPI85_15605 [Dehalococcoidia bacterium]|nr:hypothetical protein [Dehalococcoidia bacterium]